jgi:hypothetical protein
MDHAAGREPITPEFVAGNRDAWIALHRDLLRYEGALQKEA